MSSDVNPTQLLNETDGRWRQRLAGVSLVAEADIEPQDVQPVLRAFGCLYERLYGPYERPAERDKERLLSRWPACLVVGMSEVAAAAYEEGTYWPKLCEAVDFDVPHGDRKLWGEAFIKALDRLGLPIFSGTGLRFLSQILMHCGIPTHCLKDLLDMLVEYARRDPGLDADSFVHWATNGPNRMNHLDKPVRRLIQHGGEYAYDIIDRLLVLLDRLHDPKPDLWGIGLPDRLVNEARSLADRKVLGLNSGTRRTAQHRGITRPRLALDPFGEGPRILLPATRSTWRVTVDGSPHDIRTTPTWPGDAATETSFPLARSAGQVQVRPADTTEITMITVVRQDDPLLVFTEDGELIPHGRPIPSDRVWVLYPEDRKLEGEIRVISEAFLPFGWQDWSLQEVDLDGVGRLALEGGAAREVSAAKSPRLLLPPEPLQGVTAAHRQPVYNDAPLISLPEDKARSWHIELRQVDERATAKPVRFTERSGEVDPWQRLPRPIVGTFDVSIIGPLGFRFYRRFAVAEGLSASYLPAVRLLTDAGLESAEATLAGQAALSDTRLSFGQGRLERAITYGPAGLLITPPHMSVLHDSARGNTRWSSAPLRLTAETLVRDDPGWLLLRAPTVGSLPPLHVYGNGITHDVRSYGAQRPGQARYRLNQITDTVEASRRLDIKVRIRGSMVPVASVRPQQVATGVVRDGADLRLIDCATQPGLHVGIYSVYEPWREVTVLPVRKKGVVVLPVRLRHIGSLRVLPAMRDPSASWPPWPSADDSFLVRIPLSDNESHQAAVFVAGEGPCPENIDDERMWELVALAKRLEADGARQDLHAQCDMRLRSYPVLALRALARSRLNPDEAVVEVIRTGLAGQQMIGPVELHDVRLLWGRLRVVAALLSGGILANPARARDLFDVIYEDHGEAMADLLLGATDPYQEPGNGSSPVPPGTNQMVDDAIAVLNATPYRELASRIHARSDGNARGSAALALAMRAIANTGIRRDFRSRHRTLWADLARSKPDLVSLDIVVAQAAISAVDRRSRIGGAS